MTYKNHASKKYSNLPKGQEESLESEPRSVLTLKVMPKKKKVMPFPKLDDAVTSYGIHNVHIVYRDKNSSYRPV